MKRIFLFSVLVLAVLLTMACGSDPTPAPPPPTAQPDQPPPPPLPPVTNNNTGNRHSSGIILDGATSYAVQRGDTLSSIAKKTYNDGSLYPLIMMVSGNIVDPDKILPQQTFTIPDARVNMSDSTARQAINRYFTEIARLEEQRGRRGTAEMIRAHTR